MTRLATWALLGSCAVAVGCGSGPPDGIRADPPLRPLLYTEISSRVEGGIPGFDEWLRIDHDPVAWPTESGTSVPRPVSASELPRTPDQLMSAVYEALLTEDAERLRTLQFDAESYTTAARTGAEDAVRQTAEIAAGVEALMDTFRPATASQARADGLRGLLESGQITVGRGRNIDGSAVTADDVAVMHWGSEMTLRLRDTQVEFVLRFPRILVGPDGIWRLADAPSVDGRFIAFRALGMDLKPEMMTAEHSPFPLSVGNYWHYSMHRPLGEEPDPDNRNGRVRTGYRDEVVEIDEYTGYRIVLARRLFDDPNRPSQTQAWLSTALRLYTCNRDCQRNAADPAWILGYAQNQIPLLVFPAEPGAAWGTGGLDSENNVWRISPETSEVVVPAGTFPGTVELSRSVAGGSQRVYFAPGIGFVMRRNNAGLQTEDEELIDYRIMP